MRGIKNLLLARGGFTLLEMVIFAALFAIAAVSFMTILVSVTRIQVRQGAAAEVNQQSQFLLQTIQRYVEQSSLIEMTADAATSTLKLRMPSSAYDPTYVYLSGGTVYLKESDAGTPQALSSSKVNVTNMVFTKRSNPTGHDSVDISFAVEYAKQNAQQAFSQILDTAIARVSAATFDSNVVPSAGNTYKIGVSAGDWQSINNTIFFSGSNVGIGAASPGAKLQISSGDVYVDTTTKGLVLRDSGGGCWRVTVNASGTLSTASMTCP